MCCEHEVIEAGIYRAHDEHSKDVTENTAMVAVNATASSALAALKAIKPLGATKDPATPMPSHPSDPTTKVRLSPRVSDALLKIGQIVTGQKASEVAALVGTNDGGYSYSRMMDLSELPDADARKLRGMGADAAVRIDATPISQDAFEKLVLSQIGESYKSKEGFSEALANGTLKIQKAESVPELGLGSVRYNLYKDGSMIGGAGWGADTFNKDLYMQRHAEGINQATGSINGHSWYVTW